MGPVLHLAPRLTLQSIHARLGITAASAKRFIPALKTLEGALGLIRRRMEGEALDGVTDTTLASCVRVYLRICLSTHCEVCCTRFA